MEDLQFDFEVVIEAEGERRGPMVEPFHPRTSTRLRTIPKGFDE
ncbi:hypothetical protein Dda3937_03125 [Dickeya dadantii 3937]|uniref:Uncharacterized protein n=1 Tax=Dickeya dadantii (strain 3937) TaxID=198628 RepID=E0SFY3_DICD3|nr:hypothetical protein Dda3937_03125 [Dickeya dadantii 3937]